MSGKKILVVDDSDTDAHLTSQILTEAGYQVVRAKDGTEGVEKAKSELPDAVLMDVVMPGLNGFQATRQITKGDETQNIPVLVVTTKNQKTDEIWAKQQGAKDFINKPVEKDLLLKKLETYL